MNFCEFLENHRNTISTDNLIEELNSDVLCGICKKLMINPTNLNCGCRFCRNCIEQYFNDDTKTCPNQCTNFEAETNGHLYEDFPMKKKIYQLQVKCSNSSCGSIMTLKELNQHWSQCKELMECPYKAIGCDSEKLSVEDHQNHTQNCLSDHLQLILHQILNTHEEPEQSEVIKTLKEEIEQLKEKQNDLERQIEEISEVLKQFRESTEINKTEENQINETQMKTIESKFTKIDDFLNCGYNWQISDFTTIRNSKSRSKNILSESFYLHGYHFSMRLYPNGLKDSAFVSLAVFIMPGIYDVYLMWPVPYKLTVSLLANETEKYHSIVSNPMSLDLKIETLTSKKSNYQTLLSSPQIVTSYSFEYRNSLNSSNYARPAPKSENGSGRVLLEIIENFISYKALAESADFNNDKLTVQISLL